jgi:DNA modification methylase
VQADAVQLPVADDTVDLVITSPPYFALRSYQDDGEHYDGQIGSEATPAEFLDALWAVTAECVRVLKPSGSIWVNLGDKYAGKSLIGLPWRYAIGCIDDLGLILRAEVVWSKPNGLPESVTDRVRRSHEQWFHFTLEPRYFSALDEIREPHKEVSLKRAAPHRANVLAHEDSHEVDMTKACHPLGKLPGSVWSIPSEPLRVPDDLGVDHFAAFPQEWPRRLILGWCPAEVCTACGEGRAPVVDKELVDVWHDKPPASSKHAETKDAHRNTYYGQKDTFGRTAATITGYACACPDTTAPSTPGVVLDPFAGTGTVPMVARALNRVGIGVDLSADYLRLAAWRVFESGHASKTVARTNGERQGLLL